MNRRQEQIDLEKAVNAALAKPFDWCEDRATVEQHGGDAVVSVHHTTETMKTLLKAVQNQMPEVMAERFAVDSMLHGYSSFPMRRSIIWRPTSCIRSGMMTVEPPKVLQTVQIRTHRVAAGAPV